MGVLSLASRPFHNPGSDKTIHGQDSWVGSVGRVKSGDGFSDSPVSVFSSFQNRAAGTVPPSFLQVAVNRFRERERENKHTQNFRKLSN